jgi:hypothetical protein
MSRLLSMESRQVCCLRSQAKNEALNSHHHCRPPFLDCLTSTFHCYKIVISTLVTLLITQPRLYFISSLAKETRIGAPPDVVVLFHHRLTPIVPPHNNTHGNELTDPLSLFDQLINL